MKKKGEEILILPPRSSYHELAVGATRVVAYASKALGVSPVKTFAAS